jgi:hypothetical protein
MSSDPFSTQIKNLFPQRVVEAASEHSTQLQKIAEQTSDDRRKKPHSSTRRPPKQSLVQRDEKGNPIYPDPKDVLNVEWNKETGVVTLKRVNRNITVSSEALLYHLAASRLTKPDTDALWFARTPARSPRGELWIIHNPRVFEILVDPLAICRSAADEFNRRGSVELWCFRSRREYLAINEDQTRVMQPTINLNDDTSAEAPAKTVADEIAATGGPAESAGPGLGTEGAISQT